MKSLPIRGRTLALFAIVIPLLVLFVYLGLRSGPLAPVTVVVAKVQSKQIKPALFGIGTVEARYSYKIGPTFAGRIKSLQVHVGDTVTAGQLIGQMEEIDLDDKIRSQEAALKRAQAILNEVKARHVYAQTQARRYEKLFANRAVSQEQTVTKKHELQIATAALAAAQEDLARADADRAGLEAQRQSLRLIYPRKSFYAQEVSSPYLAKYYALNLKPMQSRRKC